VCVRSAGNKQHTGAHLDTHPTSVAVSVFRFPLTHSLHWIDVCRFAPAKTVHNSRATARNRPAAAKYCSNRACLLIRGRGDVHHAVCAPEAS
jgi:hypothetical protein